MIYFFNPDHSWAGQAHDCICPYDETVVANPGTQSCGQIKCPACGNSVHRALYVGTRQAVHLATPEAVVVPPLAKQAAFASPATTADVTYTNTISGIIEVKCSRCHSGPFRNLMTYEKVKTYVDNELLQTLVKVGGPMNRFAEEDAAVIIDWAKNGAPK